jgi:hypothetical protein
MHYDSDSSHEDEIPKKPELKSHHDLISRRYSMFSGKHSHHNQTPTDIGVNLKKIKKNALRHRCHSLSTIATTVQEYVEDDVSLFKTATPTHKINRRASFPASNGDIWNEKKNRIERVL